MNKDSLALGLTISIILPILLFFSYLWYKFGHFNFGIILDNFVYQKYLSKILSIAVFPNGIVFFYYIQKNKLKTMRGMLIGTVIMAAIVLVIYGITYW